MGGDIRLQSEEGNGTGITFQFPVTVGDESQTIRAGPTRSDSMNWSIPARGPDGPLPTQIKPIETIALYIQNPRTFEHLTSVFLDVGISVVNTDTDPMNADKMDCDAVFVGM